MPFLVETETSTERLEYTFLLLLLLLLRSAYFNGFYVERVHQFVPTHSVHSLSLSQCTTRWIFIK